MPWEVAVGVNRGLRRRVKRKAGGLVNRRGRRMVKERPRKATMTNEGSGRREW
jgi:hypothetical protein